jgi:hypothetical protein
MVRLKHTAEEIDRKLSLIDENKNYLEYPYDYVGTLPKGLSEVGDGSFLTTEKVTGGVEAAINLKTIILEAGTYYISFIVTDILDNPIDQHNFALIVTGDGVTVSGNTIVVTSAEKAVIAYLHVPSSFDANWLIKPQIIKTLEDGNTWTPNMDKIGSYVDRRFNSTNVKIVELSRKADLLRDVSNITASQLNKMLDFLDCIELDYNK